MKKLGSLFLKVLFIYLLGVSVVLIPLFVMDFTLGTNMTNYLLSKNALFDNEIGMRLFDFIGISSIVLAIWDGQFFDDVKLTHWSRKRS